jgi:hypothetical protein
MGWGGGGGEFLKEGEKLYSKGLGEGKGGGKLVQVKKVSWFSLKL